MENSESVKNKGNKYFDKLVTMTLLVVSAIVPFIVQLKTMKVSAEVEKYWKSPIHGDLFSYYKSRVVLFIAFIMLCLIIYGLIKKYISLRKDMIYIPIFILTISIILSTVMSKYPNTSLYGFPDRQVGVFVLISYIIIMVFGFIVIRSKKQVEAIVYGLTISAAVFGIIGIFQYYDLNILESDFVKTLTVALEGVSPDAIEFRQDSQPGLGKVIYTTMYNPNTYGLYISLLFPFTLYMGLFSKDKITKIIMSLVSILMFANLLGSFSRGSYLGIMASVIVMTVILRKKIWDRKKHILVMIAVFITILVIMNSYSQKHISSRIMSLFTTDQVHIEDQEIDKIKDFYIDGGELQLRSSNTTLKIIIKDSKFQFFDEFDRRLKIVREHEDEPFIITDERYAYYEIMISSNLLKVKKGKSFMYFAVMDDTFELLNEEGVVQKITEVNSKWLKGYERIGSGRGYIWSRSIPLIGEHILIGSGPDTFAFEFPQEDFRGKLNYMYDAYILIDKPHNMYIQTAINTGVVSLLVLLSIIIMYLVRAVKKIKNSQEDGFIYVTSLSILAAIVGYLVTGLFTDSAVSVAPVFWALLGIGICLVNKESNIEY